MKTPGRVQNRPGAVQNMSSIPSGYDEGKAWLEADARVKAWLRKNANLEDIAFEEVANSAQERWAQERKNAPEQYAKWELLSFKAKMDRRRTEADTSAVESASADGATIEDVLIAAQEPAVSAAPRVERFTEYSSRFRDAVKAECLKQFSERLGKEWETALEKRVVTDSEDWDDLEEAHEVHEELRQAILRAIKFVEKKRRFLTHVAPLGLGWWVPERIVPISRDVMFEPKVLEPAALRATSQHESPRHRLVANWDAYEHLGIQRQDGNGSRALDATEFAIVWLLGGGWPRKLTFPVGGLTPSQVIQTEARTFRSAIKEVGRNWIRGPG